MNEQQSNEIKFIDFIKILILHKWVLISVFVSILIGSTIYSFLATPIYRAEVLVAVVDEGSGGGGLSSLMSSIGGSGGLAMIANRRQQASEGIATLESQQFIGGFIKDENLLPILYESLWDSEKSDWKVSNTEEIPTLSDGYRKFTKMMTMRENSDTQLIELSVEWTDPELATKWANDLIFKLNERLRSSAIQEANQTIDYLKKEVEKTRIVELQQAIYFMIEEQINISTMANIKEEYAFKVISPAISPELDQFVSPNRLVIIILALLGGLLLGMFAACISYATHNLRTELAS